MKQKVVSKNQRDTSLFGKHKTSAPAIYLAGAIEFSKDGGVSQRKKVKKYFEGTHINFIDPCDFEYNKTGQTLRSYQLDKKNNILSCLLFAQKISEGDIEQILQSDGIIAILDENCSVGTGSELTMAKICNIPVYAFIPDWSNWRKIHPWIIGQLEHNKIFVTYKELKQAIMKNYPEITLKDMQ